MDSRPSLALVGWRRMAAAGPARHGQGQRRIDDACSGHGRSIDAIAVPAGGFVISASVARGDRRAGSAQADHRLTSENVGPEGRQRG